MTIEPPTKERTEQLFFDGDAYFDAILHAIARARHSIHFESYIFENGPLGQRVIDALSSAARRGVSVRLLIDGVGSLGFASESQLTRAGVSFHYYHPVPSFFLRFMGLGVFTPLATHGPLREFFHRLNHRDHRKMCLIDDDEIWIGSFNVSSRHLRSVDGGKAWRDTGICIKGIDPLPFELAFRVTWYDRINLAVNGEHKQRLTRKLRPRIAESPLRTETSGTLRRLFFEDLIARIQTAQTRVWITTPYFIPPRRLLEALLGAAQRKVDVRLLLPGPNDVPIVGWISSLLYPSCLRAGVRIYVYQPSILHAKCTLIDGWAMLGSSNLNFRSSLHDVEANYATTYSASLQSLERQYRIDLDSSVETHNDSETLSHKVKRLIFRPLIYFRYWM